MFLISFSVSCVVFINDCCAVVRTVDSIFIVIVVVVVVIISMIHFMIIGWGRWFSILSIIIIGVRSFFCS